MPIFGQPSMNVNQKICIHKPEENIPVYRFMNLMACEHQTAYLQSLDHHHH